MEDIGYIYIFLPPYSCVRQVYTLQSSLLIGQSSIICSDFMNLSRALGLCSAQAATLRNLDFRLTWSVVVKYCHAMIGHSGGGRDRGIWPELS